MGYWVELRCDVGRTDGCYSMRNNGPMGCYHDARAAAQGINRQAADKGWKRRTKAERGGWECPSCYAEGLKLARAAAAAVKQPLRFTPKEKR